MIKFTLIFVLFTGTLYVAGVPISSYSGYEYNAEVDAWLRLRMVPASWAAAGMNCYLEGGLLASPTTSAMASVMTAMMAEKHLTYSFTGINSIGSKNNFSSLDGPYYAASAFTSEYEYRPEVDAWLRLHIVPAIWSDAGMRCYLEGGTLASPNTKDMLQTMSVMMAKHKLTRVFTGINCIPSSGNYKSLEGVPVSSIPSGWIPGQPDNDNMDEDCVVLTRDGKLADMSCESLLPYFCRKENKCGPVKKGYQWEPRTGSCYKLHGSEKSWRKAQTACHSEGGHLAVINNQIESTVLKDIMNKKNEERHAFIGFMQYYDKVWATINGDTLSEAGFTTWNKGEPSSPELEKCGSIYRNGLLNDAPCDYRLPYLCEFTP
ncbi:C-type mannose receptor 2 [Leguminivora glycinivorella]|uniref:C-type mannose receptor 2 n=1 Tax=Leguminivora glycinivorella TaxID=1035111 RepID=UPI002010B2CA|nr:C-type mannose receptor 2 [Leguminivora glycinivorella]